MNEKICILERSNHLVALRVIGSDDFNIIQMLRNQLGGSRGSPKHSHSVTCFQEATANATSNESASTEYNNQSWFSDSQLRSDDNDRPNYRRISTCRKVRSQFAER